RREEATSGRLASWTWRFLDSLGSEDSQRNPKLQGDTRLALVQHGAAQGRALGVAFGWLARGAGTCRLARLGSPSRRRGCSAGWSLWRRVSAEGSASGPSLRISWKSVSLDPALPGRGSRLRRR